MKLAGLLYRLALALALLVALCPKASAQNVKGRQIPVDFFDQLDMPLKVDRAVLIKTRNGYRVEGTAANRSDEQLRGVILTILFFGPSGKMRDKIDWSSKFELGGSSIRDIRFELPKKVRVSFDGRVVLAVEYIIGERSIWESLELEKALRAYVAGDEYVMPVIKRVGNQLDSPIGQLAKKRRR